MANDSHAVGYRFYWWTWAALLALTLGMLLTGHMSLPKGLIVSLLLGAMLVKASLIGGHFMHLRFEKPALVVAVVAGILATAATLFALIAVDGARILRLSAQ